MTISSTSSGTAKAAQVILAMYATAAIPTVSVAPHQFILLTPQIQKTSSGTFSLPSIRETTLQEKIIGEIRSWNLLESDWDGEGSSKPSGQSIEEAVSFVNLLSDEIIPPEPMLLSSGHIALFWNEADLYADIEFLGDSRIAYFIKKVGEKHKGVLEFDSQKMPAVFPVLLRS